MRFVSLAFAALLVAFFLFGCTLPKHDGNSNNSIMNLSNFSIANFSIADISNFLMNDGGTPQAGNDGGSGAPASEEDLQAAAAVESLRASVCNDIPGNAMHLLGGYVAVLIPANFTSDAASLGDSITFTSSEAFVGSLDPITGRPKQNNIDYGKDNYYWNCWANGGTNTHICIIPVTVQIDLKNGTMLTQNGAIRLTFEGGLEPVKSACNWTQEMIKNATDTISNINKHYPLSPSSGAPAEALTNLYPQIPPECVSPPAYQGGESGPHEVYAWNVMYWIPMEERIASNPAIPGPLANTPTFTRTNCELVYDSACPPMSGSILCGQCQFTSTVNLISTDMPAHPSPGKYIGNLGQCRYCPEGTTCSGAGGYGSCGDLVCMGSSQPPSALPFYIGCSDCPGGSTVSYNYQNRGYDSWADCINAYNYCHATLNCGRILDNCRGQRPS